MARLALAIAAPALVLAACGGDPAPLATAQRIGSLDDTIGGPHSIGQVGDFLLENDQIRLIIADKGPGRVNTTFGGSLVDADLRRPGGGQARGNDQLAELLPGFAFTVIDPTQVEISKDGADGGPAEIRIEGTGGDLLQTIALLNTGLINSANLSFTQIYRLRPGQRWVEIETTVHNKGSGQHPLPFLNPSELDNLLGQDIPGIGNLQLSVPMGQLPLFGGEQDLFAPGVAGFNIKYGIEDSYKIAGGFPGFPGLVADFLATRGNGVSYGLTIPKSDDNYVNAYAASYPMQDLSPYSMLLPFTYTGVAAVYMYKPPGILQPDQKYTFTSYFVVGRGDVASVADTIYTIRGQDTGTFGGRVVDERSGAAVAGASVMVLDAKSHPVNQIETDADGAFLARLPPGDYSYTVVAEDRLVAEPTPITVAAGKQTGAHIAMASPATLVVSAIDELGRHAPVKIQLVGKFSDADKGKDPRTFLYALRLGESTRPTAFDGGTRFIEKAWWTKDGRLSAQVRPGTYELVVSRGPEYEVTTRTITLAAGSFAGEQVALVRAYKSDGWVAGDFHIHAQPSTDSNVPIEKRVISCAAEGLEVAVATDHNYITDYAPAIAASGLDPWLVGVPGMELTTFEMGHFNGYPLRVDPGSTRGGEFLWVGRTPQQIFDTLRDLAVDRASSIVHVTHPRQQVQGYFASFFIDGATGKPYTPTGLLGVFSPYGEEFKADKFSYDFDTIELLTGKRTDDLHDFVAPNPLPPGPFPDPQPVPGKVVIGADGRAKFPGVIESWFTLLDHGHQATGLGVSDAHHLLGHEPGYARSLVYVGTGKDVPGGFVTGDVINGLHKHRAITTNGPFIEMTAAGGMIGDTVVGANIELRVRVRAPTWAKVNKLVIYSNSAVVKELPIPDDQGTDFEAVVPMHPARDAWVVAEAVGTTNMFPVVPATEFPPLDVSVIIQSLAVGLDLSALPLTSSFTPARTHQSTPYAITNPIWIDIDGNGWTAPKPMLRSGTPPRGPLPDVRAQFDALPEVTR